MIALEPLSGFEPDACGHTGVSPCGDEVECRGFLSLQGSEDPVLNKRRDTRPKPGCCYARPKPGCYILKSFPTSEEKTCSYCSFPLTSA